MKKNYFRYTHRVGIGVIPPNQNIGEWVKRNNVKIVNSTRYSLEEITDSNVDISIHNAKIFELIKSAQLPALIDETIDSFQNFCEILNLIEFNFIIRSLVKNKARKIIFLFYNKKGNDFIVKFSYKEDQFILRIEKFPDLLELMAFPEGNIYNHNHKIFFVVPE